MEKNYVISLKSIFIVEDVANAFQLLGTSTYIIIHSFSTFIAKIKAIKYQKLKYREVAG